MLLLKSKLNFTSVSGRDFNQGDTLSKAHLIIVGVTDDEIECYFEPLDEEPAESTDLVDLIEPVYPIEPVGTGTGVADWTPVEPVEPIEPIEPQGKEDQIPQDEKPKKGK